MTSLIGALRVSLSADTAAFQAGMKRAEGQAKASSTAIGKSLGLIKAGFAGFVSGLSIGALARGLKSALDYAGSLGEVAQQLGVTTRELQVFRFAVQQNGGTLENADQALGKFAIAISKARSGSKQAAEAFAAAGVSLKDLETKSKTEILGQVADRFKATGGAAANAAAGVAIFGKGFLKIVPVLDQGSAGFNEVAAAAEKLGIIMDDSLIVQADEASDTLDALSTILKTQVSVAVAESAGAIIDMANAISQLIGFLRDGIGYLSAFRAGLNSLQAQRTLINPFASKEDKANARATVFRERLNQQIGLGQVKPGSIEIAGRSAPGSPSQFLGGGGKSKRGGADDAMRKQLDALRDAFQFEQDIRRAQLDVLRAQESLATDYTDRANLAIEQLNLEKQSYEAELAYQVAAFKISKGAEGISQAQADQLKLEMDKTDAIERQIVRADEQERRQRDYEMLEAKSAEIRLDLLDKEAGLAETASERRAIELKILELAYEEERRRLQRIIDESNDWAEIEAARRDLLALTKKQGLDRAAVVQGTRGPMEDFLAGLPTTAAKTQEAFEQLQVQGFEGLIDSALALSEGFGSAKDALLDTLKQFLLGVARLELQKALGSILGSGGIPGHASGGFTGNFPRSSIAGVVHGQEYVLNAAATRRLGIPNLDALNRGAPLSAVSNDNDLRGPSAQGSGGDFHAHYHGVSDYDSFRRNERQMARSTRRTLGINQ